MSEYQYYEFAAIDRPLTGAEMAELREVSTRADITPSGFRNHYEWGDLKADPADWMRRYFDAFVYTANWCSCQLTLRFPRSAFSKAELWAFAARPSLAIDATNDHWILTWSLDESEDYDRFGMDDGGGWMHRLAPLRDELLRGDLRPLYLGWLATVALDALDDDVLEPALPPGLADLSTAQLSLVKFLGIDPDMLGAATDGSAVLPDAEARDGDLDAWLTQWSHQELVAVLKLMVQGQGQAAERQVRSRHAAWVKAQQPQASPNTNRRSVAQLREAAKAASSVRQARASRERAVQEVEQRRLREAHLQQLMTNVKAQWAAADAQVQRGSASSYEQAVRILAELAEGYALTATPKAFDLELRRLLVCHAKRGAFVRRLSKAGLWSG